jgi:small-conductance mechanosensitive channel
MTPRRAFLSCCLVLALVLAGVACARADDDKEWPLVLETLHKQDQVIRDRLEAFKKRHAEESARQSGTLELLQRDRARLALWQATATDPWEIRDVIAGFSRLRFDLERLSQRPEQSLSILEQNAAILESYKERLAETRVEVPERFRHDLEPTRKSIESLSAAVTAERDALAAEITPLRDLAKQVKDAERAMQASMTPAWKTYYLEPFPAAFSSNYLLWLTQDIQDWKTTASLAFELMQTNRNQDRLLGALPGGLAAALVMAVFGLGAMALARRKGWSPATRSIIRKTTICLAAGLFLLMLAWRAPFFLFSPLSATGEILLTAALVHLSRLSRPMDHSPARPPVLWPTWRLFALGLVFEGLRVPEEFMSPVMAIILAWSAFAFHRRHRATPQHQRLDRTITRGLSLLLPVLAGLSLYGLPQTAILCASGLFYTALALRFAAATTRILGRKQMDSHPGHSPIFLGVLAGAGFPFFFLAYLSLFLWLLSTQFGGENVFIELLTTEARIESVGISLQKVVTLIAGFYGAKACIALSAAFISDMARRRRAVERGAKTSLLTINTYLWWGLYALFVMSVLGLSLTSVAVVAGGLSVGIGFGMQTMVNNFISGLILLFGRSVQAGDTIQIGNDLGVVREVNIRNTEVLTKENATVFVPNSELVSGKIINWSHKDPSVRRDICVGVAYGSDTNRVGALLLEAARSCPAVMADPAPSVLHWDFGPSTLDFRLRVWLVDVDGAITAMSAIRSAIDRLFRKAGIEIAFPQTDLHLRSAPALERLLEQPLEAVKAQLAAIADRLSALETKTRAPEDRGHGTTKDTPHDA